ncbi:MAG: anaerobic ribonucleoside-triphosphate reductase activating protein [Clostridia bacterium]|nr:anaerobic ribonucleoside-triphosphate reductase activating protein [Clostridia bacterium]MBR5772568.1 anaerobic ribonucleoside-triphosphate reductase activating protein [Clostridia bacterium]
MNIQGLQKLTLLDFPGKMACTVFTGGCNLRCPFCHNSPLVINPPSEPAYSEDEIFDLLQKRKGILEGVAITGGEPLMQPDIEVFMAKVKQAGFAVKLDTNGTYPEKLKRIVENGLADYVAMDVKSSKSGYPQCVGIKDYDTSKVNESMEFLKNSGADYEFRTTVAQGLHTAQDIEDMGKWVAGAKRHYLQQFKDSGELIGFGLQPFSKQSMLEFRDILSPYVDFCDVRGI